MRSVGRGSGATVSLCQSRPFVSFQHSGTVTLKISWAPVNVVKTGEMFFKHKGDAFFSSTMGKYLRHDFRLLCAENNGEV